MAIFKEIIAVLDLDLNYLIFSMAPIKNGKLVAGLFC